MKKILILTTLILFIISALAFLMPLSSGHGMVLDEQEQIKAEEYVNQVQTLHFNGIQRGMTLNYQVKDMAWVKGQQCYEATISFQTIFNAELTEVKINCEEIVTQ